MRDGGPAFARSIGHGTLLVAGAESNLEVAPQAGMSLRDYFAAAALQGMCGIMDKEFINSIGAGLIGGRFYVQAAFILADAMLLEREKQSPAKQTREGGAE